jgi:DNA repair protein RecO (recombination protein O)
MGRSYKTDAVVLRSIRFSEADRVLHLYTLERGRVNAIAKGVRKTGSRFGARLEPLTRSALILHEGRGELHTVSGADIISSQEQVRADGYALAVGQIGAEAVLKLFAEPEPNPRAYEGLCRFLELLAGRLERASDPQHDGLGLAFQLKLLALSGYLPHLDSCASCGTAGPLAGFSAAAGGAVCTGCMVASGGFRMADGAIAAIEGLLERPLAPVALSPEAAAGALRVVEETYAHHGGFRLRTLQPS